MKVIENLNITPEELYTVMIESFTSEYNLATRKNISPSELKPGLKYKKKSSKRVGFGSKMIVEILEVEENRKYTAKFTTRVDESYVTYEIMPKGKRGCMITYTEEFSSDVEDGKKLRHNDEDRAKMNTRRMFRDIEQYVIKNRRKDAE